MREQRLSQGQSCLSSSCSPQQHAGPCTHVCRMWQPPRLSPGLLHLHPEAGRGHCLFLPFPLPAHPMTTLKGAPGLEFCTVQRPGSLFPFQVHGVQHSSVGHPRRQSHGDPRFKHRLLAGHGTCVPIAWAVCSSEGSCGTLGVPTSVFESQTLQRK